MGTREEIKIDLVYPLSTGSYWGNNELRYSLRSVEKHLKNYGNIYVIGEIPDWCADVRHVFAEDRYTKTKNIMSKLTTACKLPHVSDPFLYINDDHFLVQDEYADCYPNYAGQDKLKSILKEGNLYGKLVKHTMDSMGIGEDRFIYFDVHAPMLIYKSMFLEAMDSVDWTLGKDSLFPYGYVVKSLYGNFWDLPYTEFVDRKIGQSLTYDGYSAAVGNGPVFSMSDAAISYELVAYMEYLYPKRSLYERG